MQYSHFNGYVFRGKALSWPLIVGFLALEGLIFAAGCLGYSSAMEQMRAHLVSMALVAVAFGVAALAFASSRRKRVVVVRDEGLFLSHVARYNECGVYFSSVDNCMFEWKRITALWLQSIDTNTNAPNVHPHPPTLFMQLDGKPIVYACELVHIMDSLSAARYESLCQAICRCAGYTYRREAISASGRSWRYAFDAGRSVN
ncbi:MAG: hypothetical protein MJZ67_06540 [Bacteroidales bacterium]|nr:hypothetical protein [Bacteroidales bacterium]